jgi:XTP/dITP diphosphohydrolase
MTIWFASGNSHKKTELAAILNTHGTTNKILIPSDAGIDFDPDETGTTFYENALIKARELYSLMEICHTPLFKSGDPIIADDSGICVDALDGRPGIYSARYAGRARYAGANSDMTNTQKLQSEERNALLLEELGTHPVRTARFVCAMVILFSPDRFYAVQETFEGEIVSGPEAAKGRGGFGYDPIFLVPGLGRTAAELSDTEKNTISHRAKAGKIIATLLEANLLRNYA